MNSTSPFPRRLPAGLTAAALLAAGLTAAAGPPAENVVRVEPLDPRPIRIGLDDLPEPFASESASNSPEVVPVPDDPALRVPPGFAVNLFAGGVEKARWLALTPEGDVLCSCGRTNQIHRLRDLDGDGVADERDLFLDEARGANLPFGMDFARIPGENGGDRWAFYLGNTDAVLRYPYEPGQAELGSDYETIAELPGRGYNQHWTRNVRVAPDGEHLFVTVGSKSNVDREDPPRASVLRMRLDGSERETFAAGLRNPVGLDFHPRTGAVHVNVNERDKLGDGLVPDYLARVERGQFFGWPYAYLAPENLDPRRTTDDGRSERPDLAARMHSPDVLYRAHSAALGLAFPTGGAFPAKYRDGAFSAFRGSWNRSRGTGYKLVFVPFGGDDRPRGFYEDFLTGFLLDPAVPTTWGRPVGVLFAADGSLLFTEEAHGRIYRVSYSRPPESAG